MSETPKLKLSLRRNPEPLEPVEEFEPEEEVSIQATPAADPVEEAPEVIAVEPEPVETNPADKFIEEVKRGRGRPRKDSTSNMPASEVAYLASTGKLKNETFQPTPAWKHEAEWDGREIFIGFPAYKATNPATTWTLIAMMHDLGREKMCFDIRMGDAMIYHARNELAMLFLASPANWLLFVDDDMVLPIGRPATTRQLCRLPQTYPDYPLSLHAAHRLMGHGKTIVGATYFGRHIGGSAICSLMHDPSFLSAAASFDDRVMPCDWIGTGCLLIHRSVFTDIQAKFPELAPSNDEMPWNFFQPEADGRGEDIAFCGRALACDHQPYVDTALHALHVGFGVYGQHTSASTVGLM